MPVEKDPELVSVDSPQAKTGGTSPAEEEPWKKMAENPFPVEKKKTRNLKTSVTNLSQDRQ